jgi:type VI secretion system protein
MTLRLSVVSEHGSRLGAKSSKVFGVHGGSIGRGTDNEWILPDPERYLSGKHARVDFRAGTYVLVDTSSNGTYVNGAQVPLGKYHDYVLKDGDYIRLGEYEMLVSIDKSNDFPTDASAIVAYDGQAPSSAVRKSTANDLGAELDLNELLEPSDHGSEPSDQGSDSGVLPRDAYGQTIAYGQAMGQAGSEDVLPDADDGAGTPWHMMTRPLKVEGKVASIVPGAVNDGAAPYPRSAADDRSTPAAAARASTPLFDGDLDAGIAAFCRGAGVDPRTISADARNAALQLAGQLLRESVIGLMDLNQNRNEFRNRFRIAAPADDGPESPLNFSRGVDEALVRLLTTLSTRAGSVDAIRHNFREHKAQNVAATVAMRAAFEEFLGRVDPKALAERFERGTKRSVFGAPNKAKYWDLYAELFGGLAQRPADGFPHLFVETFAKAFEAKLRTLVPPRRTAFGADRHDPLEPDEQAVGDS